MLLQCRCCRGGGDACSCTNTTISKHHFAVNSFLGEALITAGLIPDLTLLLPSSLLLQTLFLKLQDFIFKSVPSQRAANNFLQGWGAGSAPLSSRFVGTCYLALDLP